MYQYKIDNVIIIYIAHQHYPEKPRCSVRHWYTTIASPVSPFQEMTFLCTLPHPGVYLYLYYTIIITYINPLIFK